MSKFGSGRAGGFYSGFGGGYEKRAVEIVKFVDRGKKRTTQMKRRYVSFCRNMVRQMLPNGEVLVACLRLYEQR